MGRRRHTLNADEPFIAAVSDAEAAVLFGECSRSSVFLHPPEGLVKGLLALELTASFLTSLAVLGLVALAVPWFLMPWLPTSDSGSTDQLPPWRMPFPVFAPCGDENSPTKSTPPPSTSQRFHSRHVCVRTAFTPGPSTLLDYPKPPKVNMFAIILTLVFVSVLGISGGFTWVTWSDKIIPLPGAIAASVLGLLSSFPVWFAHALRRNLFRFLLRGYGRSFTSSIFVDDLAASPTKDGATASAESLSEEMSEHRAPLLSDTERIVASADGPPKTPAWAWLDNIVTIHPVLLLLRACNQCAPLPLQGFEEGSDTNASGGPSRCQHIGTIPPRSLFKKIPRTAADLLRTMTNRWNLRFVLAVAALAEQRERMQPAGAVPVAGVAFAATLLAVAGGVLHTEASFESDVLERWSRAVEEIPRRILETSSFESYAQLLEVFSSWYPTGLNHRDRTAPFVTIANASFGFFAVVVLLVVGLQVRSSTWQVLVAKHVAAIHDVAMFGAFLSLTAAFASVASVTPTFDDSAGGYIDAKVHQGFANVAELSHLWERATGNKTSPFDTVSFTQLHPAVPSSGTEFVPVCSATSEDLQSQMANLALFAKQPWAMTWPTAIALVASIVPACIGFVATVGRGCVDYVRDNRNRTSSVRRQIVAVALRVAFALIVLPAYFAAVAVALFVPCLSLFLHFGNLEENASLPANALLHGLCDEADRKRESQTGSVVSDSDTAAVSVFKTLCAATLPPPPLSVNECPKANDLSAVKNGWSRRVHLRLPVDQSSDDEDAGANRFDDDTDTIRMKAMRRDSRNADGIVPDSRMKTDSSAASPSRPPRAEAVTAAATAATPSQFARCGRAADVFIGAPIWSRTQKQRRALATAAKVRIRARFEELDVAYFNRPISHRSLTTLKDFFEDEKLEGDFALFWIMYRELAPERVIDAVAEEIAGARALSHRGHAACDKFSRERTTTPRRRKSDSKNEKGGFSSGTAAPPASMIAGAHVEPRRRGRSDDDDDYDDFDDFELGGIGDPFDPLDVSPAERTRRAAAVRKPGDLDSLPASIHAANLFQHFDEASRREFEIYCQRKCEYTARLHHRSCLSDGSVADAMMLHTDAVLDVEQAVQRDPSLWTSAHHLAGAASANLFPIVRDPDREVQSSVCTSSMRRQQYFQLPLSPFHAVPRTVGGEAGQREEPIPWFSEGGFVWGGRLPFFGLARAVGSTAELARVLPQRLPWFLLHAPFAKFVNDVPFVTPTPFMIATVAGRLVFLFMTFVDVPLVLLTCRKTTSVWEIQVMARSHATNFTQIGGVTNHSFECVPTLTLVLYGVRILCLFLLAILSPAVMRHLRRGFLWSLAPRFQDDQKTKPPWSPSSDAPKNDVSIFRAGSRVHTENAEALGYMMARPESKEMELAVRCLVEVTTPKPVIELLRHVPHRVVPRPLAVRIVAPFLPAGSLV